MERIHFLAFSKLLDAAYSPGFMASFIQSDLCFHHISFYFDSPASLLTCEDHGDSIVPTHVIQNNPPISKPLTSSYVQSPFCHVSNIFTGSGNQDVSILGEPLFCSSYKGGTFSMLNQIVLYPHSKRILNSSDSCHICKRWRDRSQGLYKYYP